MRRAGRGIGHCFLISKYRATAAIGWGSNNTVLSHAIMHVSEDCSVILLICTYINS